MNGGGDSDSQASSRWFRSIFLTWPSLSPAPFTTPARSAVVHAFTASVLPPGRRMRVKGLARRDVVAPGRGLPDNPECGRGQRRYHLGRMPPNATQ